MRILLHHAPWRLALLLLIATLPASMPASAPASAQNDDDTLVRPRKPRFRGVDGDTVKFGTQLVRLFGIDAPDKDQSCDDGQWHPGPLARKALEDFIAGRPVACRQVFQDHQEGPPVAQCYAGDDDLQAMMVSAGWAWAFGRYSQRYDPEERDAVRRQVGVDAHRCQPPWEWRARQRSRNQ